MNNHWLVLRKNNKVKQIKQGANIRVVLKKNTRTFIKGELFIHGNDSITVGNKVVSINSIQSVIGPKRKERVVSRSITGGLGLALVISGFSQIQSAKKMDGLAAGASGAGGAFIMIIGIPFLFNSIVGLVSPQVYRLNKWKLTIENQPS